MSNYLIESMLSLNGRIDEARNPREDMVDLGGAPNVDDGVDWWSPKGKPLSELTPEERAQWEKEKEEFRKKYGDYEYDGVDLGGASLAEARNPENDEINKVIARTAGRRSISPEDKKALQDAGIHRGRGGLLTGKGGRGVTGFQDKIYGPCKKGWSYGWDRDNYGDVDFKNYLDKPINNDKWAHDYDSVKALHPYTRGYKEYGGVVDRYNDEKATQEYQNAYHKEQTGRDYLSDEDIEAQAQEYKQELIKKREARANKLANLEQKKHDYVAKAKEQHAAKKKNESLSLKEDVPPNELYKQILSTVSSDIKKIFDSVSDEYSKEEYEDVYRAIYKALYNEFRGYEDFNLSESLSLKEGLRGSNLWGELFDEACEHIYDAIVDTLNSIDWLDDDEIDIDDTFVSELSQQLASELCDTVDDMFGEIITR